ncbi:MAG: Lycopene beta-cyclase [Bacteroidota bacterium]|jgi:lycopene beta-cyclase
MSNEAIENPKQYTYIIAGGGMAGLSLAYYLSESSLTYERILILDQGNESPKTWSYWSDEAHPFDAFAEYSWGQLEINSFANKHLNLTIAPFVYRKIESGTWTKSIQNKLLQNTKFEFIQAKIEGFSYQGKFAQVLTDKGIFEATEKVFDSVSPYPCDLTNPKELKQHFVGLFIETNFPLFDPNKATLFDFRIAFTNACEFMYVLPTCTRNALFEHTFFSSNLLDESEYLEQIKAYLFAYHGLSDDDYEIKGTEKGIIPMNYVEIPQNLHQKIIKIGTSGGFVKASTGYSFKRTQGLLNTLVSQLESSNKNAQVIQQKRFKILLDRIFIQVLVDQQVKGSTVFEQLFEKNSAQTMLRFLDEQTSVWEDLRLMTSVPTWPFMKAFFKIVFQRPTFYK